MNNHNFTKKDIRTEKLQIAVSSGVYNFSDNEIGSKPRNHSYFGPLDTIQKNGLLLKRKKTRKEKRAFHFKSRYKTFINFTEAENVIRESTKS